MELIRIAGIDSGLRNTGIAFAQVDVESGTIVEIEDLKLIRTFPEKSKKVRKSSADYNDAATIAQEIRVAFSSMPPSMVFAEVPSGTQSARASFALGIALGVVASVKPTPMQVTPTQTKMASVGIRTATKHEMIEWAYNKFPTAPWHMRGGKPMMNNEHLADAIGVIMAGLLTPEWTTLLKVIRDF